jgi:hypothetical protein
VGCSLDASEHYAEVAQEEGNSNETERVERLGEQDLSGFLLFKG